jgi:hypothetical protein
MARLKFLQLAIEFARCAVFAGTVRLRCRVAPDWNERKPARRKIHVDPIDGKPGGNGSAGQALDFSFSETRRPSRFARF